MKAFLCLSGACRPWMCSTQNPLRSCLSDVKATLLTQVSGCGVDLEREAAGGTRPSACELVAHNR